MLLSSEEAVVLNLLYLIAQELKNDRIEDDKMVIELCDRKERTLQ